MSSSTTKSNHSRRRRRNSLLILLVPLLLSFWVAYTLWLDTQEDASIGRGKEIIASIRTLEGETKRRPGDRFRWFKVGGNKNIYAADSVSTGKRSKIAIVFKDGTEIQLGENTLFTVEKRGRDGLSINLRSGSVQFNSTNTGLKKTTGQIIFEAQGKSVDLGHSQGSLQVKDGSLSLDLKEGKAVLKNGDNTQTVQAGKKVEAGVDGSSQQIDGRFQLVTPTDGSVLQNVGTGIAARVTFNWKKPDQVSAMKLELAGEPDFSRIWQSIDVSGTTAGLTVPEGKYYWRVSGPKGSTSETFGFELIGKDSIQLVDPPQGSSLILTRNSPETFFHWEVRNSRQRTYEVTVATDASFRNTVTSQSVTGNRLLLALDPKDDRGPVRYFWKVEHTGEHASVSSGVGSFTLERTTEVKQASKTSNSPDAAALSTSPRPLAVSSPTAAPSPNQEVATNAPAPGFENLLPKDESRMAISPEVPNVQVRFSWRSPTQQKEAELIVRRKDASGAVTQELFRKKVNFAGHDGSFPWTANQPGEYEWELKSQSHHSTSRFTVTMAEESMDVPAITVAGRASKMDNSLGKELIKRELDLQIAWKPVEGAASYRLIFSKNKNLEDRAMERTVEGLTKNRVDAKNFPFNPVYYRVEATLKNGQTITSPVSKFSFKFLAPTLTYPKDQESFSKAVLVEQESDGLIFSWEHTNFTQKYVLEIAREPRFSSIAMKGESTENFYIAKGLAPGRYWWRTRSKRIGFLSEPSVARAFEIKP